MFKPIPEFIAWVHLGHISLWVPPPRTYQKHQWQSRLPHISTIPVLVSHWLGTVWDAINVATLSWVSKRLSWNSAVTLNLEPQRCSEGNLVWKTSWYVQQISKSMVLLPNSKLARGCCPSTRGLLKFFRPSTTTTRSWYNIIAPNCRLWSSCYRGGLQHGKCVHPNFWGQHTKNIKRHLKHTPLKINMEHNHGGLLNGWFVGSMWIFRGVWRC